MELIKRSIHMNKLKCQSDVQLTLDNDFNVPDIKPDIGRIIKEKGDIVIDEIKTMNGKAMIRGSLNFNVLYMTEDDARPVHHMSGQMPFEEVVNMDNACAEDDVSVHWEMEDMRVELINSRKISAKALVCFTFTAEDLYDQETAVGVSGNEKMYSKNKKLSISQLALSKKDTFRMKDEIKLPTGKPNVLEVLYDELSLQGADTRMMDGQIGIKGDLKLFLLYIGDDEEQQLQYYETEVPYNGTVDCSGCNEDMISDIVVSIRNKDVQIKADEDGEERVIDIEAVLEMTIKVYREEELDILSDVYSTAKDVEPTYTDAYFENLIMKNNSKSRVVDKIMVDSNAPQVLQIINANGEVRIDDRQIVPNGIEVSGVIEVQLLYMTDDDRMPMASLKGMIPFTVTVEMKGMKDDSIFNVMGSLDSLSVMMLDGEEIEIKAVINLNSIAFDKIIQPIIEEISVNDLDFSKLQEMPGIIGYIVKNGDTLWNIAKKFYTTIENIMELNSLENENIKQGDKLMLMKQIDMG